MAGPPAGHPWNRPNAAVSGRQDDHPAGERWGAGHHAGEAPSRGALLRVQARPGRGQAPGPRRRHRLRPHGLDPRLPGRLPPEHLQAVHQLRRTDLDREAVAPAQRLHLRPARPDAVRAAGVGQDRRDRRVPLPVHGRDPLRLGEHGRVAGVAAVPPRHRRGDRLHHAEIGQSPREKSGRQADGGVAGACTEEEEGEGQAGWTQDEPPFQSAPPGAPSRQPPSRLGAIPPDRGHVARGEDPHPHHLAPDAVVDW
mmetsp:Transcript_75207/g.132948  ORF Transcript_75207/g.132948 Transcript_75207/m.132948 type:complete len:254 (-) Transcript_75207:781-1542(-)